MIIVQVDVETSFKIDPVNGGLQPLRRPDWDHRGYPLLGSQTRLWRQGFNMMRKVHA
jgi:hypothetical protein